MYTINTQLTKKVNVLVLNVMLIVIIVILYPMMEHVFLNVMNHLTVKRILVILENLNLALRVKLVLV